MCLQCFQFRFLRCRFHLTSFHCGYPSMKSYVRNRIVCQELFCYIRVYMHLVKDFFLLIQLYNYFIAHYVHAKLVDS